MKRTKKLLALLLALVMAMAMNISAFAADITINNAVNGETYTAYKLFDVSIGYDDAENPAGYSYYTKDGNMVNLLEEIGLTFTTSSDGSTYYVATQTVDGNTVFTTASGTMTAAELASALSSRVSSLKVANSDVAENGKATITDLDEGYYFIDTTLGSLCILNTSNQNIYEKNTVPSIEKKVAEGSNSNYGDTATIDVVDTIYYQLTVNTGTNTNGTGTGVDGNYVITDELPEGINFDQIQSISSDGTSWTVDVDYTVAHDDDSNSVEITLLISGKLAGLGQDKDIVITYTANVDDSSAIEVGKNGNVNTATLEYKKQTDKDTATVYTYEIGNGLTKVDGSNEEPMEDVSFILSNADGSKYATFNTDGYLIRWVDSKNNATPLVTDSNGNITARGLDAGTYILTETETQDGYNLLEDTITVTISENGDVSFKLTNSEGNASASLKVENNSGSLLPSTGGMGTTVIYMAGAALVIVAGVTLVVRRRMRAE